MNENSLAWRGKQQSNNYITKEVSNEINEINNGEGWNPNEIKLLIWLTCTQHYFTYTTAARSMVERSLALLTAHNHPQVVTDLPT